MTHGRLLSFALVLSAALTVNGADLPITKVVIYKNGVAYFERSGEVKAGEPARLEFRASEMNDVLKSLVIEDAGGAVTRVRYDLSEPLAKKLADLPVQLGPQQALAVLLDQFRGSRVEVKTGTVATGSIVSARLAPLPNQGQKQELVLLTDTGDLQILDLGMATSLRLLDPRLDQQMKDALLFISQSRSRDKRAVTVEATGTGARKLIARYLVPAPVWKSTYRLVLNPAGEPTLEGWALVDNTTGEDWTNVDLTVVSGRPVSFVSNLYEPRYVDRAYAELPDQRAAAPVLHEGAMTQVAEASDAVAENRFAKSARPGSGGAMGRGVVGGVPGGVVGGILGAVPAAAPPPPAPMMMSSVGPTAEGREAGELFEYRFPTAVTARKGESAMIPFLQQKVAGRKLLLYSDRSTVNPRAAVEISNNTGKTLDGGPITIYQEGAYGGEALMETVKTGDKRLISYAVDMGTRVTTNLESGDEVVRELKAQRGLLTTRTAVESTTTFTIVNVDTRPKTLVVEHPVNPQSKILKPKPDETTPQHHRFNVALPAKATAKLVVVEEQVIENSVLVTSLTPDVLATYIQTRNLSASARKQLEEIAARKSSLATIEQDLERANKEVADITRDQDRLRQNLTALNRVSGQQEQVQRYANELAKGDVTLAALRDRIDAAWKRKSALEAEVNTLIEKLTF